MRQNAEASEHTKQLQNTGAEAADQTDGSATATITRQVRDRFSVLDDADTPTGEAPRGMLPVQHLHWPDDLGPNFSMRRQS